MVQLSPRRAKEDELPGAKHESYLKIMWSNMVAKETHIVDKERAKWKLKSSTLFTRIQQPQITAHRIINRESIPSIFRKTAISMSPFRVYAGISQGDNRSARTFCRCRLYQCRNSEDNRRFGKRSPASR